MNLTYFGNACFHVEIADLSLLIDPYISENAECPYELEDVLGTLPPLDVVLVTHLAADHRGDIVELAREHRIPVITEPGVNELLTGEGIPPDQVTELLWGIEARLNGGSIRALQVAHASTAQIDGKYLSGLPLSFLIRINGTTVYHAGDTALFSDLKLIGSRFDVDVAMLGVGQAYEEEPSPDGVHRLTREMTIQEAVQATAWIDADVLVPMHCLPEERSAYQTAANDAAAVDSAIHPLDAGESTKL